MTIDAPYWGFGYRLEQALLAVIFLGLKQSINIWLIVQITSLMTMPKLLMRKGVRLWHQWSCIEKCSLSYSNTPFWCSHLSFSLWFFYFYFFEVQAFVLHYIYKIREKGTKRKKKYCDKQCWNSLCTPTEALSTISLSRHWRKHFAAY